MVIANALVRPGTLALGLAVALLIAPRASQAAVTISLRAVRGGIDLEFGRVAPGETSETRELEVTCTNTGSGRYRLYQQFSGGLTNERGDRLPDGQLVMQVSQGIRGQAFGGTIVLVSDAVQELYQSNDAGASDTLLIGYALVPAADITSGVYRGIVRFTVESLETGAIETQTMRVQAEIAGQTDVQFQPFSPRRVDFGQVDPGEEAAPIELSLLVRSNRQGTLSVLHELIEPLQNEHGTRVGDGALQLSAASPQGSRPWQAPGLGLEELLTNRGGELDRFQLAYRASLPQDQAAGRYRGSARVQVRHEGTVIADHLVPLELIVPEVLMMTVSGAVNGEESLHFTRVESGSQPAEQTMVVQVRSNLGRPYQVLAGLDHPLVLPTGEELPAESLLWSLPQPGKGTALIASGAPVHVGFEPLYRSDGDGSSDSFVLAYRLSIPAQARDGMYSGHIRFTITVF